MNFKKVKGTLKIKIAAAREGVEGRIARYIPKMASAGKPMAEI